jgi:hypothetical protein
VKDYIKAEAGQMMRVEVSLGNIVGMLGVLSVLSELSDSVYSLVLRVLSMLSVLSELTILSVLSVLSLLSVFSMLSVLNLLGELSARPPGPAPIPRPTGLSSANRPQAAPQLWRQRRPIWIRIWIRGGSTQLAQWDRGGSRRPARKARDCGIARQGGGAGLP